MAGGVTFMRTLEDARTWYRGIRRCKSVTACPVCRASRMARWAALLTCHLEALRDRGGAELLVTFTMPHRRADDLRTLYRVLKGAIRDTFSGQGWAGIAKRYGYLGQAQVLETTWSPFAGYHPHVHSLMFFAARPGELGSFRMAVLRRFLGMLVKHAARCGYDLPAPDVDRAVSVQHADHAGQYITKMGLAEELTSPGTKVGKVVAGVYHLTMPQVSKRLAFARLRYGAEGPTDRARDRARFASDRRVFLEYVAAMRGQQIFRVSPALAGRINALELRADVVPELSTMAGEPADEEDAPAEELVFFSPTEWRRFDAVGPLARVELERLAEQERLPAVEVRGFVRRVLEGEWRPITDPLWGEDADSPLFRSGASDADVQELRRGVQGASSPDGAVAGGLLLEPLSGAGRRARAGGPAADGPVRRGDPAQSVLAFAGDPVAGRHGALNERLEKIARDYRRDQARDRHTYGGE
jgi:hypothetical protein